MRNTVSRVYVAEPFVGRLTWVVAPARGNVFPFALRCHHCISWPLGRRLRAFCRRHFGESGPGGRWTLDGEYIAFRHQSDMTTFLLAWSGEVA